MKTMLYVLLAPFIALEIVFTFVVGFGIFTYQYSNSLLEFYEKIGFEIYVSFLANVEEDGRCKRFYRIAKKSYLDKNEAKRFQGRHGHRF